MVLETAQAETMVQASSKTSPLRWVTAGTPTNYNMLLFRTLNRDMQQPNANQDDLAPLFRDKLMPLRMWWLKHMPGALKTFKQGLEHKKHGVPGVLNFVDARTSWFDAVVKLALDTHGISQVVVVAAGFDTRAYRIGAKNKGVRFYEVDLPHASQKKQQLVDELLQPEATFPRPTFLAADLATHSLDSVLLSATGPAPPTTATPSATPASASTCGCAAAGAAEGVSSSVHSGGFDPAAPTLFTVEGLIYYLPEEAVRGLLRAMLRVAAPGSRVAFDFLHQQVLDGRVPLPPAYRVTATSVANKGEPFVSGIPEGIQAVQAFLDSVSAAPEQHPSATPAAAAAGPTDAAGSEAAAGDFVMVGRTVGSSGVARAVRRWQVVEQLGPKEVVARQLPHLVWDDVVPPILSFYSFASAVVVAE